MLQFPLDTRQLSKDNPSQNLSQFQVCSYAKFGIPFPLLLGHYHYKNIPPPSFGGLFCSAPAAGGHWQGPALTGNRLCFCFRVSLLAVIWGSRLWASTLGKTVPKGPGMLSTLKSRLYSDPFCNTAKQHQYFSPPSFMAWAWLAFWLQALEDNSLYE